MCVKRLAWTEDRKTDVNLFPAINSGIFSLTRAFNVGAVYTLKKTQNLFLLCKGMCIAVDGDDLSESEF